MGVVVVQEVALFEMSDMQKPLSVLVSKGEGCPVGDGEMSWLQAAWLWDVLGAGVAGAAVGGGIYAGARGLGENRWKRAVEGGLLVAGCVWGVNRWLLPRLDESSLLAAERHILSSLKSRHEHVWTQFTTSRGVKWVVHSLHIRGSKKTRSRPLVVLHGHSGSSAHWECIADALVHEADLYLLDLPGWGRSPAPVELTSCRNPDRVVDLCLECLGGWMQAHHMISPPSSTSTSTSTSSFPSSTTPRPSQSSSSSSPSPSPSPFPGGSVTLLGHSIGAMLGTHFTARYPWAVHHLILADPAGLLPAMSKELWWTYGMRLLPPQVIARTTGRVGLMAFRASYGAFTTEDPRYPEYYYQLAAATGRRGGSDAAFSTFVRHSLLLDKAWWARPILGLLLTLHTPTTLLWGADDEIFPASHADILHKLRPDIDLYIIKHALHNPAHSNSNAVALAITDALRKRNGGDRVPEALRARRKRNKRKGREGGGEEGEVERKEVVEEEVVEEEEEEEEEDTLYSSPSPSPTSSSLPPTPPPRKLCDEVTYSPAKIGTRIADAEGRGLCGSCGGRVAMFKSYWRCLCGAWSFNVPSTTPLPRLFSSSPTSSPTSPTTTPLSPEEVEKRMVEFLESLYIKGDFEARKCEAIQGFFLPVRSRVPTSVLRSPALRAKRRRRRKRKEESGEDGDTGGTGMTKRDGERESRLSIASNTTVSKPCNTLSPPPSTSIDEETTEGADGEGRAGKLVPVGDVHLMG